MPSSASRGVTTQHPSNLNLYSVLSVKTEFHTHTYQQTNDFFFKLVHVCVHVCVRQRVQFYACLCVTQPSEDFVMKSGPAVLIQEARYWTDGRRVACADYSHCLPSRLIHKFFSHQIYVVASIIYFQHFIHNHSVIYT